MATTKKTATKKKAPGKKEATPAVGQRLMPPKEGATVRMYRTGHGDCFLLAFAGDLPAKPVYVLIDCGYKPGSPAFIDTKIKEIGESIRDATGGHVDVAVITHEHQDHVNGITETNFEGITIGQTWIGWTDDPDDDLAKALRKEFKDKLLGLLGARNQLAAAGNAAEQVKRIEEALAFELGGVDEKFDAAGAAKMLGAAGGAPGASMNKQSMKIFKDRAEKGVKYLRPHEKIMPLPGAKNVRVFALGPPRDEDLIKNLDPEGGEEFHLAGASGGFFAAAAASASGVASQKPVPPFDGKFCLDWDKALGDADYGAFFASRYGHDDRPKEATDENPAWRRIDKDWLMSADQLALAAGNYTNNSSLVLAFELGKGGKVLLFAADAQKGNWISWSMKDWKDGTQKITAKDLLARTVLYKVGHHGSHNATLNGKVTDDYANLNWMAEGDHAHEFTAMITAVRKWAMQPTVAWDHPKKAIKDALLKKASGRVFQTDTDLDKMEKTEGSTQKDWKAFEARTTGERLYFDYEINTE